MRKKENLSIAEYLYLKELRLEDAYKLCQYRYIRRDLDEVELLEEIIAKVRLEAFKEFSFDIRRILKLSEFDNNLDNS